jgi:hypothetical protein
LNVIELTGIKMYRPTFSVHLGPVRANPEHERVNEMFHVHLYQIIEGTMRVCDYQNTMFAMSEDVQQVGYDISLASAWVAENKRKIFSLDALLYGTNLILIESCEGS